MTLRCTLTCSLTLHECSLTLLTGLFPGYVYAIRRNCTITSLLYGLGKKLPSTKKRLNLKKAFWSVHVGQHRVANALRTHCERIGPLPYARSRDVYKKEKKKENSEEKRGVTLKNENIDYW